MKLTTDKLLKEISLRVLWNLKHLHTSPTLSNHLSFIILIDNNKKIWKTYKNIFSYYLSELVSR